jgi:hypothetical protein
MSQTCAESARVFKGSGALPTGQDARAHWSLANVNRTDGGRPGRHLPGDANHNGSTRRPRSTHVAVV